MHHRISTDQQGVTLIELIVFMVVMGVALMALMGVFNRTVVQSVDPVVRIKALEKAQATLDEILSRKFDANTPSGGVPACGSATAMACAGITPDTLFDDVGDYDGFTDNTDPSFPISVSVIAAGDEIGLGVADARRISVSAGMPGGDSLTISAYRVNF